MGQEHLGRFHLEHCGAEEEHEYQGQGGTPKIMEGSNKQQERSTKKAETKEQEH
jgi:hypothetical protein